MRDTAFKRALKILPIGSEIQMEGPYGLFVLHEDSTRPAVFLAGGIGITPIRSMLVHATHEKVAHKFYLFYSNRRPEDTAFFAELKNLALANYKFIPTMSDVDQSGALWDGETCYIDKKILERYLGTLEGPIYYIVGPTGFVLAMRGMLCEAGISTAYIKTDQFLGY